MARKIKDAIADVRSYTDAQGNEKKVWVKVGAVFDNDSMKIDCLPVGPDWSGWIKFVEPREKQKPQANHFYPSADDDSAPF